MEDVLPKSANDLNAEEERTRTAKIEFEPRKASELASARLFNYFQAPTQGTRGEIGAFFTRSVILSSQDLSVLYFTLIAPYSKLPADLKEAYPNELTLLLWPNPGLEVFSLCFSSYLYRNGADSMEILQMGRCRPDSAPRVHPSSSIVIGIGTRDYSCRKSSDSRYSQLTLSHIAFASYLYQGSQQSKGDKIIDLCTERNSRAAERNRKKSRKALWVDGWSTPAWVKARLKMITQGRLRSRASYSSYGTRDWSQGNAHGCSSRHMDDAVTTSEAIAALKNCLQRGVAVDSYTYLNVLQMCLKQKDLLAAKQVHECIIKSGMDKNPYVAVTLLNVYIKSGGLLDARRVFDELEKKTVITWTMMITGYVESDHAESALELFKLMCQEGVRPNEVTYLCILKACASPIALKWGKEVHMCIRNAGFESDVRVGNALIQMYAKCECITEARRVFQNLTNRNFVTWHTIIGAYAESGGGVEVYLLFLEMRREGFKPDAITYLSVLRACASPLDLKWGKEVHVFIRHAGLDSDVRVGNALIQMYANCGCIRDARRLFEKSIRNRNFITWSVMIGAYAASGDMDEARLMFDRMAKRDLITWNIIIGAYVESGRGVEAYKLFHDMRREGVEPDAITYVSILNGPPSAGALQWVKEVHGFASKAGLESDLRVGNSLVHMYAKSGSIDDARLVFDRMEKRNVVTWNTMIGGLAQHGSGHEALELFRNMNADLVKPNETIFVAVLSACCHVGLLDDGRRLFSSMTQDFGIQPNIVHYNCMVDLLGQAGQLEEAKRFISHMPVEPNGVTWAALLGACRTHGNVELGELAARELFKLESNKAST